MQCQNDMRKWIVPDQARPVQDCQSVDRSSPTFTLDWTGLSPTADRDRLDWWNHWRWAHLLPVRAPRLRQSQYHRLQTCKGVVENEESHCYSSSRYSRRLRSPLTICSCTNRRCLSKLLNFQKALTSYSNRTWRQQLSHCYPLRFRRCYTRVSSRSSPYSYFQLSLLSINQLDLGVHTTIFRKGRCSITLPSSCTLAGKLINESTIEPSEAPTIASTSPPSAPSTTITKSTRKSLTVSESRLWHRRLAHINPTAIKSLIEGYTHDDSMCTVCIQAKHKQRFIRVQVKCCTKRNTRCCMDLANLPTMQPATKYQAPLHNLHPFGCYASRLIPEVQRLGKFGLRLKRWMMVGYAHDSKTLWRIWDPQFQRVKA